MAYEIHPLDRMRFAFFQRDGRTQYQAADQWLQRSQVFDLLAWCRQSFGVPDMHQVQPLGASTWYYRYFEDAQVDLELRVEALEFTGVRPSTGTLRIWTHDNQQALAFMQRWSDEYKFEPGKPAW